MMFYLSPFLSIGTMFPILQMILLISSCVNSIMGLVDEGKTLLFSMIQHCFAKKKKRKKELKRSAFLTKICKKICSWINIEHNF